MIFWQKLESEGVTKHIVKNRSTLLSKPQPNPKYKNNLNIKTTPKKKLFPINEDDSKIEDTENNTTYTVRSTLYTVPSAQYTVHYTQYTVKRTQYTEHST